MELKKRKIRLRKKGVKLQEYDHYLMDRLVSWKMCKVYLEKYHYRIMGYRNFQNDRYLNIRRPDGYDRFCRIGKTNDRAIKTMIENFYY